MKCDNCVRTRFSAVRYIIIMLKREKPRNGNEINRNTRPNIYARSFENTSRRSHTAATKTST